MTVDKIRVLVTGISWMGGGVGSIEAALEQLFGDARDEILLTAYRISAHAELLFEWLEGALSRGVEVKLVLNDFSEQPYEVRTILSELRHRFPHLYIYDFLSEGYSDLHAKSIVVDRSKAVIGSSNFSRRGMLTNYELALLIEGPAVSSIAAVIDDLVANALKD